MMKRFTIFKLLICTILLMACTSDNDPETSQTDLDYGGIIVRNQIVRIYLEQPLGNDNYDATIGAMPLTMFKLGEQTIGFMVNEDVPLGDAILSIPLLDLQIEYTIEDIQLIQTVDETISNTANDFIDFKNSFPFDDSLESQIAIAAIEDFTAGIQQLDAVQKETLAKFFQANENLISNMLNTNYLGPLENARINQESYLDTLISDLTINQLYIAMVGSVFALGDSVWAGYGCITLGQPWAAATFAAVAFTAWVATKKLAEEINSRRMKKTNLSVDGLESHLNGRLSGDLSFISLEDKLLSLQLDSRTLNSDDVNDGNGLIADFFSAFDQCNVLIDKINATIAFINDNTFIELSSIQNVGPEDSESALEPVNDITYEGLTFSVASGDVSIASMVFEDEEMTMMLQLNDDIELADGEYIETQLNYTYSDAVNGFSGYFPIKVYDNQSIVGTWDMVIFNVDVPVGEYDNGYDGDCPDIVTNIETDSGYYIFNADQTFTYYWENTTIWYSLAINEACVVWDDGNDIVYDESQTGSGTYTFNGTNYTLNYETGETETLFLLEPSRIKIYEEEYVRQ